ncbi:LysR family transcriptional regulator [uncultured Vibrio sp.]|uniref:LysR family transcriptional regulator n=1 Tax=uncultured Vibrio sp. TaxID=114054 RepID=UPI0029C652B5|nr:LysR family transcriptional regulator [uncultured Vibrio sp.]
MTIKQLRAFLAVAETLSFAQACEHCHLTQSALSLTIKTLETSMGGRLFSRTTRHVRLTPEGKALLPMAKRLLAEWENVEEELHQRFSMQKGKVTLAVMPTFAANILPSMLLNFHQSYPDINIRIHDVINEQVVTMVENNTVEIGIAFKPYNNERLNFTPLFVDHFIAIVPPDSDLSQLDNVSCKQLLDYSFVSLQRPSSFRAMIEQELEPRGISLNARVESQQISTIGKLVSCGVGVSIVPSLCRQQMEDMGAVCQPLCDPVIASSVGIVTKKEHELSAAAQSLFNVLVCTSE